MRVLVTNDDGVDSPGIAELARQIERAGYEVVLVAPDHDASGTGASLGHVSSADAIKVTPTSIPGLDGPAFGISGPPALCVIAARLEAFGPVPDVVVSGINAGLNTGRSTLHSGTVGAVLAGQNFGMRGLAVSVDVSSPFQWETAAILALEVLPSVIAGPERSAVNLNVPAVERRDVRGIRWAGLAAFGSVRSAISRIEDDRLHFSLEVVDYQPDAETDLGAVRSGYASLTALHGSAEVWGPIGIAGEEFHPDHGIHAASVGHALSAARVVIEDAPA